ncbi:MAG: aminotransferase class V-fold PLP-dependent enzyme [Phycisphaerae bacterium]|nr:aminotransferase class V-fold PLP-dependent enzyme [Phycisphaerae bacterium]
MSGTHKTWHLNVIGKTVTVMHANNETGAVQPVKKIAEVARAAGVPFHTDAVQTFGKLPTRVDDLGCEFLTLSSHTTNGPKGAGALYWRGNTRWMPLVSGGDQERRMRTGTKGVHQIVGLGTAADLAARRMDTQRQRLNRLRQMMIEGMRRFCPDVRINEAPGPWQLPGSINATFPGKSGLSLLAGLDCHQVGVSIGSACTADSKSRTTIRSGGRGYRLAPVLLGRQRFRFGLIRNELVQAALHRGYPAGREVAAGRLVQGPPSLLEVAATKGQRCLDQSLVRATHLQQGVLRLPRPVDHPLLLGDAREALSGQIQVVAARLEVRERSRHAERRREGLCARIVGGDEERRVGAQVHLKDADPLVKEHLVRRDVVVMLAGQPEQLAPLVIGHNFHQLARGQRAVAVHPDTQLTPVEEATRPPQPQRPPLGVHDLKAVLVDGVEFAAAGQQPPIAVYAGVEVARRRLEDVRHERLASLLPNIEHAGHRAVGRSGAPQVGRIVAQDEHPRADKGQAARVVGHAGLGQEDGAVPVLIDEPAAGDPGGPPVFGQGHRIDAVRGETILHLELSPGAVPGPINEESRHMRGEEHVVADLDDLDSLGDLLLIVGGSSHRLGHVHNVPAVRFAGEAEHQFAAGGDALDP